MFVRDITYVAAFLVYCHRDVLAKKQHVILVTDYISCRDTLCYLGLHFHAPGTTSRFLPHVGLFILATWVFKVLSTCSWQQALFKFSNPAKLLLCNVSYVTSPATVEIFLNRVCARCVIGVFWYYSKRRLTCVKFNGGLIYRYTITTSQQVSRNEKLCRVTCLYLFQKYNKEMSSKLHKIALNIYINTENIIRECYYNWFTSC